MRFGDKAVAKNSVGSSNLHVEFNWCVVAPHGIVPYIGIKIYHAPIRGVPTCPANHSSHHHHILLFIPYRTIPLHNHVVVSFAQHHPSTRPTCVITKITSNILYHTIWLQYGSPAVSLAPLGFPSEHHPSGHSFQHPRREI